MCTSANVVQHESNYPPVGSTDAPRAQSSVSTQEHEGPRWLTLRPRRPSAHPAWDHPNTCPSHAAPAVYTDGGCRTAQPVAKCLDTAMQPCGAAVGASSAIERHLPVEGSRKPTLNDSSCIMPFFSMAITRLGACSDMAAWTASPGEDSSRVVLYNVSMTSARIPMSGKSSPRSRSGISYTSTDIRNNVGPG